jgi:hypothetical protein
MVLESGQMPKLMPPRQTLLGAPVTKFDPHGTSSSTIFDRLEDGSLQIAASGEQKNRPAPGGLNPLCMAVVEHVEKPQPQQLRIPALC